MSIRGLKSEVDQLAGSTRNRSKWSAVILPRIFQTGPKSPRSELGTFEIAAVERRQSARMGKESAAAVGWPRSRGVGAASAEYLRAAQVRPPVSPRVASRGSCSRSRSAAPLDRKDPPVAALAITSRALPRGAGVAGEQVRGRTGRGRGGVPPRLPSGYCRPGVTVHAKVSRTVRTGSAADVALPGSGLTGQLDSDYARMTAAVTPPPDNNDRRNTR